MAESGREGTPAFLWRVRSPCQVTAVKLPAIDTLPTQPTYVTAANVEPPELNAHPVYKGEIDPA